MKMGQRFLVAASFLLASASASATVAAEGFDYYTLAVSLAPAFCDQNLKMRDTLQCRDRHPFIVHGLWPENAQGKPPSACAGGDLALSEDQIKKLRSIIPDDVLRRHEWKKHGRCSGLSASAYFDFLSREFIQLKWPDMLHPLGRDTRVERDVALREFHRLNPGFPENGVVFRCEKKGRPPLLSEVRVCLTPEGNPTACTANFKPNCPTVMQLRAR